MERLSKFYSWILEIGDPRVENWLLMKTPIPVMMFFVSYLLAVFLGPKLMANRQPLQMKPLIFLYNFILVLLSIYMCYEFTITSILSNYSYTCQPVDYSYDPLAMRMASVCWWFFFSKVIELLDTVFFILRKKNSNISFLHVYHHCTMIINWWLGVKYIAGGNSWFLGMLNTFVHIFMYTYYALAALGPQMQKYLWWKRYMTTLQLTQFVAMLIHTGVNIIVPCDFPQGYNYAVFIYAITLIMLFSNYFHKEYVLRKNAKHKSAKGDGKLDDSEMVTNGTTQNITKRKPKLTA